MSGPDHQSGPVVVVSRSCPPDVGGYQRQFAMLLPLIGERAHVTAVGAVRERPHGPTGWPGTSTVAIPAYRVPRRVRGGLDIVVVLTVLLVGAAERVRRRSAPTLLVLSPTMVGVGWLCSHWARWLGGVVVRFPTAGDAARSRIDPGLTRTEFVAPGPAQVKEVVRAGFDAKHIPNAVESAPETDGSPSVVVVGRLVRRKRVDLVLDAWARIAGDHPQWRLSIIGSEGEATDGCERDLRRAANGIVGSVDFRGELDDPWVDAGDSSVFVIASEVEGSPNAVLEALARGLVVIAPRRSIGDWFDPVPPCVLFDDVDDLASSLDDVLRDDELRATYRAAGRMFVQDYHGVEPAVERWARLFDALARRRMQAGWARVPIDLPADGLVLDVGSGRFPNARADVLCERYPVRGARTAVIDRPFVIADAEQLPFRDDAFAVAIASHLLEHVEHPGVLLGELSRVGSQAYVETPSRRFERFSPEANHLWVTWIRRGELHVAPNRWASLAGEPARRLFQWLYYSGEQKEVATLQVPGPVGRLLRTVARLGRGMFNRTGVTTTRYRFDRSSPSPKVLGR